MCYYILNLLSNLKACNKLFLDLINQINHSINYQNVQEYIFRNHFQQISQIFNYYNYSDIPDTIL